MAPCWWGVILTEVADQKISTSSPTFRRFWTSDVLVQLGGRVWVFLLPVIAIQEFDANAQQVGYLAAAASICYLVLGLPAGAWLDRVRKRRALVWAAVARAVCLAIVSLLWAIGSLSLVGLGFAAVVIGGAGLAFNLAHDSFVPFLVEDGDVEKANSYLETSSRLIRSGAPPVMGFLVSIFSPLYLLIGESLAHAVAVSRLRGIPDMEEPAQHSKRLAGLWADIYEGLTFIATTPALRRLVLAVGISNIFGSMIEILTPVLVLTELGFSTTTFGFIFLAAEVGGIAGATMLPRWRRRFGMGAVLTGGLLIAALSSALLGVAALSAIGSNTVKVALLMASLGGTAFGGVTFAVSQVSLRQRLCPPELQGRVNASMRFVIWGVIPFAGIFAGLLAALVGTVTAIWICVVLTIPTIAPIIGISRFIPSSVDSPIG